MIIPQIGKTQRETPMIFRNTLISMMLACLGFANSTQNNRSSAILTGTKGRSRTCSSWDVRCPFHGAFAFGCVEDALAQANILRGGLDEFVVGNVLDGPFQ